MKKFFKHFISITIASTLLFGCVNEAIDFDNKESEETTEDVGYLSFNGLNINVDMESGDEIITRAISEADGSFVVKITSVKDSKVVYNGTYSEIKALSEPLAFAPGVYIVDVKSTNSIPMAEWDSPEYAGSKEVSIVKNFTTEVDDLICTLANIKTSLTLSADLKDLFLHQENSEDNLNVKMSIGSNSLTYNRDDENKYGYFAAVEEKNTLKIELSGMYNTAPEGSTPKYEKIENWTQTIPNVKAGEWRKVYIRIDNASSGNVRFEVTIETWVYDKEIDVDIMSDSYTFEEEEIYDPDSEVTEPNSPTITLLNGHKIEDTFLISTSIFDFDSESCSDIIKGNITPVGDATVSDIEIDFESDNELLLSDLVSKGYDKLKVNIFPTNDFSDYLTIKEDDASNNLTFTLKYTGMVKLYNYVGTHTIRIMAKDSQGRRSYTNLVIKVDKVVVPTSGPSIVWNGGYSFDNRYNTNGLVIDIDITSETGITDFIINITSDALSDAALAQLKLASTMDLINPATPEMESALRGLGFPVGDDVRNAKNLNFNITSFMMPLSSLGLGNSDFKLTITDASGTNNQTVKVVNTTVYE